MPEDASDSAPKIAADPHSEVIVLLERSNQLQQEILTINNRIKELNEQIGQRDQSAEADRRGAN